MNIQAIAPTRWRGWDDEAVAMLKNLALERKLTSGDIASAMSHHYKEFFTRNTIIGQCRRKGIALPGKPPAGAIAARSAAAPKPPREPRPPAPSHRPPAPRLAHALPSVPDLVAPPPCASAAPLEQRMGALNAFLDIGAFHCRWPIRDPTADDFHFCAAAIDPHVSPYCGFHRRMSTDRKNG